MSVNEHHFAVSLKRSPLGRQKTQRLTVLGLGLKRFGKTVYLKDTLPIRGMLYKVSHLINVERKEGVAPLSNRSKSLKKKQHIQN